MSMANQQPHVAVLAFPFGSHVSVLLNLAGRLAATAPDVTFSFFSTARSNEFIFKSQPFGLNNLKAYEVEDGIPEKYLFTENPVEEIDLFIRASPDNFKKSIEMAVKDTRKKIGCVMSDAFLWFGGEIAEEMGVSWVSFWIAGASTLSAHLYTDLIRESLGDGKKGCENESLNFIAGLSAVLVRDLPEGIASTANFESLFSIMLYKMSKKLTHVATLTLNTFEELDPIAIHDLKSKFQHCLSIGPLTLTCASSSAPEPDNSGCLQWLDSQKHASVAYISFGTASTPPRHEIVALAEGLEESGVPFLWSLKDKLKMNLPDGFLSRTSRRGMAASWVPQTLVLEHPSVGVFVTHCGWNSVLESITGRIPMIFRPFFGDHMMNGRFVSDVWGIGLRVKDGVFTKDGVVSALETILSKEEGEKMKEKIGPLRDLVKHAIGPNGISTKNFNSLLKIITTTSL